MELTKELIEKARKAADSEELIALAKEQGITLTAEEAETYFDLLHKNAQLSDEELEQITGGKQTKGGCSYSSDFPYYLITTWGNHCGGYVYWMHINNGTCYACEYLHQKGLTSYCKLRTKYNDPYR